MALDQKIADGFTQITTDLKATRTNIGNNIDLTTATKSTLVGAINEVKAGIGGAGASIDDSAPSSVKVYSSSKTEAFANAAAAAAAAGVVVDAAADSTHAYSSDKVVSLLAAQRAEITGTATAALDTFGELADRFATDEGATAGLVTAVGNRVRFDAPQTLTSPQKAQAIANIGAISAADIGDVTTDFAALVTAGLA